MALAPQTNQSARQASVRAVTGSANTYEGDWHFLFDLSAIPVGTFNERLLRWINLKLSTAYAEINGAMAALAAHFGVSDFSSLGAFDASTTPAAPVNTVAPALSGIRTQGQVLTTSNGSWTGSPLPAFTYQWKRAGSNISGATSQSYTLVLADVGQSIKCTVTATNGSGSASADSNAVTPAAILTISGSPGTTATVGTPYAFAPTAAGGHTTYVFSLNAGTLPAGLSLDPATGAISGTPTTVQTQSGLVIRVTDADGLTADLAGFAIAVSASGGETPNAALLLNKPKKTWFVFALRM